MGGVWRAGTAKAEITPPLGVSMTGYANRPGSADHVLDPLFVRVLALVPEGEAPVVLVSSDLLGLSAPSVRRIRRGVSDVVSADRLLLNDSHTHAGPTTTPLRAMGDMDGAYVGLVERRVVSTVREALRKAEPARLAFGTAPTAIGLNRRELRQGKIVLGENGSGLYDPTLAVLRVDHAGTGTALACWFSHATHPVIMSGANTGISAEWPGIASEAVAKVLGCVAQFAQGCCGDINPVRRGDHAVVRSVGHELAGSVLTAWERAEPVEAAGSAAALETVLLPQHLPSPAEAAAALAEVQARYAEYLARDPVSSPADRRRRGEHGLLIWAEEFATAARSEVLPAARMEVQALRLGDVRIVATGAETFMAYAPAIQQRGGDHRTVVLGYTNGCIGYLPTADAFPLGGYEVETAYKYYGTLMVTPAAEQQTLEAAQRLLAAVA
jgi:hypothetical protein